jgi:hypothetical protein
MIFRRLVFFMLLAAPLRAEVVRIEVKSRADVLSGKAFGSTGAYEKLSGKIYFAVDPRNSANRIVTDIDLAPRNAQGKVEFSSDFYLIKPKDPWRGNGTVLYEVSNRGNKGMLGMFDLAAGSLDPETSEQYGDGFLLAQGYTLLWIGWQFDVPVAEGRLRTYVPIAHESNGRPIRGIVRSDFVPTEDTTDASLADRGHQAYAVSDPKDPVNVLTVRDLADSPRTTIPRTNWEFTPDGKSVHMASGFKKFKIYEVVYRSQDPPVVGLGPAGIRDTISTLKYSSASELSLPQGAIKRAIGFGISQSGRFLRSWIYYGFNEDESHRKVFDGIMAHVAGGGRGSFNHRFAQPSRDANPHVNFFYPADIFPFTDIAQADPDSGKRDGVMTHATKPEFLPKVFYSNSSHEYWGRSASLFHTTVDSLEDAQLLANVRAFLMAGGSHGVAPFPPSRTIGQQLSDPLDYRWAMRNLLVSMNRWVTDGTEPPASAYPRIGNGTLVKWDKLNFPKIPNVAGPVAPKNARASNYGPDFETKGIVTQDPPKLGYVFQALVPKVDGDGNDIPGIRMPELTVPLATYTGWNLFNEKSGPTNVISTQNGSFVPFPRTRAERESTKDPRLSVEERYKSRGEYLDLISKAAADLVQKGYLLKEDVPRIREQAAARWDYVVGSK